MFFNTLKELGISQVSRHAVNLKGIDGVQTIYKIAVNKTVDNSPIVQFNSVL